MAMLMSFMGLSSAATRLELSFPQRLQRWMMAHSPPFLKSLFIMRSEKSYIFRTFSIDMLCAM